MSQTPGLWHRVKGLRASHIVREALGVSGTLVTRGIGSVGQFLLSIYLARFVGAEGVGEYYSFVAWVGLLATVGGHGLPLYILRTMSQLSRTTNRELENELLLTVMYRSCLGSLLLFALTCLSSRLVAATALNSDMSVSLVIAALTAIFTGQLRILAETLKAKGKSSVGIGMEFTLLPATLLAGLLIMQLLGYTVTGRDVMLLHLGVTIIMVIIGLTLCKVRIPRLQRWRRQTSIEWKPLASMTGILVADSLLSTLPYLILPYFSTSKEIGQFAVVHRMVALSATILNALGSVFSPNFARLYQKSDMPSLRAEFRRAQMYSLCTYLPFLLSFLFIPGYLLGLFGGEFALGVDLLRIMAVGRLVVVLMGLTEYFLSMTGHEWFELASAAGSIGIFVILSIAGGVVWGIVGIATAYSIALASRSVASFRIASRVMNA